MSNMLQETDSVHGKSGSARGAIVVRPAKWVLLMQLKTAVAI